METLKLGVLEQAPLNQRSFLENSALRRLDGSACFDKDAQQGMGVGASLSSPHTWKEAERAGLREGTLHVHPCVSGPWRELRWVI